MTTPQTLQQGAENSRDSVVGAGWWCPQRDVKGLLDPTRREKPRFQWLNPKTLIDSRNDVLAKRFGDPSAAQRELWLCDWYGHGARPPLRIERADLAEPSFVVIGDTGEGDVSQYAALAALDRFGHDTDFMVICSDVVYPGGEVEEYEFKFFHPYRDYPGPIYALPGNHDWYDDLHGFMFHFCGRERAPRRKASSLRTRVRDALWRRQEKPPSTVAVQRMSSLRPHPRQQAQLPGPYYVVETGPVELVAIDTGITNGIDRRQGDWLREVSRSPKPKILLTGKPLYVDGHIDPCDIEGGGTVDAIVREGAHNYVAAIGGDIHNYQRYTVDVGGRAIQYIVSGGGGAFMHATHTIDRIDLPGVTESDFRCYPLRGDSLSFYSTLYDHKLPGSWSVEPDQAAAYMAERLGIAPTKHDVKRVQVGAQARKRAGRVLSLPGRAHGPLHTFFSAFFDWDRPPLFKHLLRVDAAADRLTITCHPATGCVGDDRRPPEDVLTCERQPDGTWRWRR